MTYMPVHTGGNPVTLFGRQMRKERASKGWSLRDLADRAEITFSYLGRIENGKRPPTMKVALALDRVFPERKGYFVEMYEEMRTWAPPGFRDWGEHEEATATLRDWSPTIITGLLQTEAYARAILETSIGTTPEITAARLAARMERQKRLFAREVRAWFLVDELSLWRLAGTAETMAAQMDHLCEVSTWPGITLQVVPAIAVPGNSSGLVIVDSAAFAEHVVHGGVFTEPETVTRLDALFDTLRAESYRAKESLRVIKEMRQTWTATTGESLATAMRTAATASKPEQKREWWWYGIPPTDRA